MYCFGCTCGGVRNSNSTDISSYEEILDMDVKNGLLTKQEKEEILELRIEFERRRPYIEAHFPGSWVAISCGNLFIGDSLEEIEGRVPSRYYAEQVRER